MNGNTGVNRIYPCSCGCEGLAIEEVEGEIYISMWDFGLQSPLGFRERLQYCWRILRYGKPYADMVVFDKETTQAFVAGLEELLNVPSQLPTAKAVGLPTQEGQRKS